MSVTESSGSEDNSPRPQVHASKPKPTSANQMIWTTHPMEPTATTQATAPPNKAATQMEYRSEDDEDDDDDDSAYEGAKKPVEGPAITPGPDPKPVNTETKTPEPATEPEQEPVRDEPKEQEPSPEQKKDATKAVPTPSTKAATKKKAPPRQQSERLTARRHRNRPSLLQRPSMYLKVARVKLGLVRNGFMSSSRKSVEVMREGVSACICAVAQTAAILAQSEGVATITDRHMTLAYERCTTGRIF